MRVMRNNGTTAIMIAALGGHLPCLKFLVEQGADVRGVSNNGETAILAGALGGHLPCVQYLLEHGATLHLKAVFAMLCRVSNDDPIPYFQLIMAYVVNKYGFTIIRHGMLLVLLAFDLKNFLLLEICYFIYKHNIGF